VGGSDEEDKVGSTRIHTFRASTSATTDFEIYANSAVPSSLSGHKVEPPSADAEQTWERIHNIVFHETDITPNNKSGSNTKMDQSFVGGRKKLASSEMIAFNNQYTGPTITLQIPSGGEYSNVVEIITAAKGSKVETSWESDPKVVLTTTANEKRSFDGEIKNGEKSDEGIYEIRKKKGRNESGVATTVIEVIRRGSEKN